MIPKYLETNFLPSEIRPNFREGGVEVTTPPVKCEQNGWLGEPMEGAEASHARGTHTLLLVASRAPLRPGFPLLPVAWYWVSS